MRNVMVFLGIALLVLGVVSVFTNLGLDSARVGVSQDGVFAIDTDGGFQKPVLLTGVWNFYPNRFIDPDDIPLEGRVSTFVPSDWNLGNETEFWGINSGYGSYHVRLEHVNPGMYGLWIDTVYTAFELYVDGNYLGGAGTVGMDAQSSKAQFSDLLTMFEVAEKSYVDIVLLVSNNYHPVGGIGIAPIFGSSEQVEQLYTRSVSLAIGLVTIFLTSIFTTLFFHGKLNKDSRLIYFAVFCFALALKVAASNSLLGLFFPNIPIGVVSKIEYLTIPLAAIAFSFYWRRVFGLSVHRWIIHGFQILLALYILLILTTPIPIYYPFLMPIIFLIIGMGLVWTIQVSLSHMKTKSPPGLMVFGIFVMLVTIVMQAFYYEGNIPNIFLNHMAALGMAFFVLVNFHTISYRFMLAKHEVKQAAQELETKVLERTQQLHVANENLAWNASHDALTKLMNRNELMRRIDTQSFLPSFSVVYLDMDNFKLMNDMYSHKAGDLVLQSFASKLLKSARTHDMVFRVGGDEFVVLMPDTDSSGVLSFAKRLFLEMETFCVDIAEPLHMELGIPLPLSEKCRLTGSMGLVVKETGTIDVEFMIQQADEALLVAKANGKNRYELVVLH